MNEEEFLKSPSGFLLGREFIIVLVIVFSGISFTLGYFVGRSSAPVPTPSLQPVDAQNRQQKQEPVPAPQPPIQSQTAPVTEQTAAVAEKEAVPKEIVQAVPAAPGKPADKAESREAAEEKMIVYAVQLGAFRNLAEAKQLKAKFDKKGYKSAITAEKNKKGQKMFKVKTGEFHDRKDAEMLAVKLGKSEGLKTYVTTKNE